VQKDPTKRPSADALLSHAFIRAHAKADTKAAEPTPGPLVSPRHPIPRARSHFSVDDSEDAQEGGLGPVSPTPHTQGHGHGQPESPMVPDAVLDLLQTCEVGSAITEARLTRRTATGTGTGSSSSSPASKISVRVSPAWATPVNETMQDSSTTPDSASGSSFGYRSAEEQVRL
jgi:hypothetical protein